MIRYNTDLPIPQIDSFRILLVEDEPVILFLEHKALNTYFPFAIDIIEESTLAAAVARLQADPNFDIIVTDLKLSDAQGTQAVEELARLDLDIPIVVLTVIEGSTWPKKLLLAGADDYLDKSNIVGSLGRVVLNTKVRFELIKQLRQALTDKDATLRLAANQIADLERRLIALESHFSYDLES